MAQEALFKGLVYDERGNLLESAQVGSEAFYIIEDNGFRRHVLAEPIDRYVLSLFVHQLQEHKDLAIEQTLSLLGRDDLFTKAAIDASLRNIDMDEIMRQGLPDQARDMLAMMGFRVVIDYHGDVVEFAQPAAPDEWE